MLEVLLLGEQRICGGPRSLERPTSARSTALLGRLVLHAAVPQARQQLAGIFWPDSPEAQARTNLRRELHHLRLMLGADPSLVIEPTALTWHDRPTCRVDVRVFETERKAALSALAARDGARFLEHAEAALGCYRGELMPGAYDGWVLDHRERLRQQCVDLCEIATREWRTGGDPARAIAVARMRVRLDPLAEAGYRVLMELHAESGDRAAAMSTYHRCATVLEQELGISPDPETVRAFERLLGRRHRGRDPDHLPAAFSTRRHDAPGSTGSKGSSGAASSTGATSSTGTGLIGRDVEVGLLRQRWERATRGEGGLIVVRGEAGVGKSRLLADLADRAGLQGAAVATTRCFGVSGRLPLAPVAEWLRSSQVRSGLATLEPVWQVEVERLVPPVRAAAGIGEDAGASSDFARQTRAATSDGSRAMVDAWQRHRFFEGLARAVLATARPTLLVLDDLQWCDQETLAWLVFLLGFAEDAPLLVAATDRSDAAEENPDLSVSLRALRSAGLVTELTLAPLDPDETAALAASVRGRPLAASQRTFLHAATGGYPLFVLEAARSLPDEEPAVEPTPSADLTAVLRHRLEQISPAARQVAALASAVGRDFTLDLLTEAGDLDAETLVQAVDELWRRHLLRELRGGYDFSHDLLRDAAYDSISPARRWLLHRRLAQGLELLHQGRLDDVAAQLAEQYVRGGRPDRALHYFARSAELAASVFANAEALRHHRRCLELVRQLPAGRARDRQELNVLGAMSAPLNALLGYSSTELQWTLERSVALAELLGEHQVQLADLVGLFCVRFVQGHTAQAHEIAARALGLARAEADPDLTGQAHFAYAGTATSLGLPRTAVTHFDLACDLSTGTASLILGTRLEVHARAWAAHAHWLLGDEPRAVAMGADAVQLGRSSDHPYSLAVGLAYAAITDQLRGDIPSMLTAVAELRALCRRYDFAYYAEWAPILEGWATGGDAGITLIREGIARLRSQGSFARMPYWLSLLAETLIDAGRLDAARGVLDGAVGAAYQRDDRWWLPEVLRRRAALEPGPEGVERLRRAVDIAAEQHSLTLEARCRADLRARTAPEAVSCDDGVPGVDGVDGVPGFDGVPDVPGVDGRDEVDGVDGRSSVRIVRSPRP